MTAATCLKYALIWKVLAMVRVSAKKYRFVENITIRTYHNSCSDDGEMYSFLLYKLQCVIGILATEKCSIRTRVMTSYQTHMS